MTGRIFGAVRWLRRHWIVAVLLLLLLAAGSCVLLSGDAARYETDMASRGEVEKTIAATGVLHALTSVEIGAEVSGLVRDVYVDFNDSVERGQVLAELDPVRVEALLRQAGAQRATANASVAQSRAQIRRAAQQLEIEERTLDRTAELADRGFATTQQLDQAEARVAQLRAELSVARSSLAVSNADVERAEAALADARNDVARSRIVAPIDGVVVDRLIEPGQTIASTFQTPVLFRLAANLERMKIEARVDEADIGQVTAGQTAKFRVDAYPREEFAGTVSQVRKQAVRDGGAVAYAVIIDVQNEGERLLPGMTATVDIVTGRKENVLRLPLAALRYQPRDETGPGVSVKVVSREEARRLQQGGGSAPVRPTLEEAEEGTVWLPPSSSGVPPEPLVVELGLWGDAFVEVEGGDIQPGEPVIVRQLSRDD
ncbi:MULTISPECIES: efflux RND transporter periplasmic adaptor subunit [Pacificimonas]|nr:MULTISPECIES: efflux RND transporter periplasmic adaptor subunit [Pacificimonas]MBZ6380014.1 efflux RND transporter periplasmic adaptor subunit [Pacificimonas aurantium]